MKLGCEIDIIAFTNHCALFFVLDCLAKCFPRCNTKCETRKKSPLFEVFAYDLKEKKNIYDIVIAPI